MTIFSFFAKRTRGWQKARVFLIVIVFLVWGVPSSSAIWGGHGAEDLLKDGKAYYEQERYDEAAHQFSKVLLIDPNNQEALEYLKKMGLSDGLYGYQKTPTQQIVDFAQTIEEKENNIANLEYANAALDQYVVAQKNAYQDALIKQRQQAEQIIAARNQEIDQMSVMQREALAHLEQQQALLRSAQEERTVLAQSLAAAKEDTAQLAIIQQALDDKDEEIHKLEQALIEKDTAFRERMMAQEKGVVLLEKEMTDLDRAVFDARQAHYQDMETARKRIQQTDAELTLAEYKALAAQHQVTLQEGRLLELQQRMQKMRSAYDDLDQNFEKAHAIIMRLKSEQTFRLSSEKNKKDREILIRRLYRQDALVSDLKKDLIVAKQELKELKSSANDQDEDVYLELQEKIAALQKELDQKETELSELKDDNEILEMRLEETQEDLEKVQGMVVDRDEMIQNLDQDIAIPEE